MPTATHVSELQTHENGSALSSAWLLSTMQRMGDSLRQDMLLHAESLNRMWEEHVSLRNKFAGLSKDMQGFNKVVARLDTLPATVRTSRARSRGNGTGSRSRLHWAAGDIEPKKQVAEGAPQEAVDKASRKKVECEGRSSSPQDVPQMKVISCIANKTPSDDLVTMKQHSKEIFDLKDEMNLLWVKLEQAVITAGYLAIAASQCTQNERIQLYARLQEEESELELKLGCQSSPEEPMKPVSSAPVLSTETYLAGPPAAQNVMDVSGRLAAWGHWPAAKTDRTDWSEERRKRNGRNEVPQRYARRGASPAGDSAIPTAGTLGNMPLHEEVSKLCHGHKATSNTEVCDQAEAEAPCAVNGEMAAFCAAGRQLERLLDQVNVHTCSQTSLSQSADTDAMSRELLKDVGKILRPVHEYVTAAAQRQSRSCSGERPSSCT